MWSNRSFVMVLTCVPLFPLSSTVMYEMLTGRWPYAGYAAETIIYMVGTGFRQTLDKIECPKQLKVCTNNLVYKLLNSAHQFNFIFKCEAC